MEHLYVYDPLRPWLGGNIKGGDPGTFCPGLWDFLINLFNPSTLCDVGCGEGHLIDYFQKKGIRVTGIDGLDQNRLAGPIPIRNKIVIHDFRNIFPFPKFYDMVISCEFVEHVDEKYSINYLDQFKQCKILVFTHATPGQIGYNHVNCRPDDYWIRIMTALKFTYLKSESEMARILGEGTYWNTTLIFKNNKP
jgi:SAM-dependent methyltransferase